MTIERQHGHIIFVCDRETSARCDGYYDTETGDFNEALRRMTGAAWRVFGSRGSYIHCCPRCLVPR